MGWPREKNLSQSYDSEPANKLELQDSFQKLH